MAERYFHVDHRCLKELDDVSPHASDNERSHPARRSVEEILEGERANFPGKPKRDECVFVFDDERCAEQYWRTHDRSFLYEVAVEASGIKHVGDMNWIDEIGREVRKIDPLDRKLASEMARKYWSGDRSNAPCNEYLFPAARVIKKLRNRSDLKAWIKSQVTRYDPAQDTSIEELLKITEGENHGTSDGRRQPMIGTLHVAEDRISVEFTDGVFVRINDAERAAALRTGMQWQVNELIIWIDRARAPYARMKDKELLVQLDDNRRIILGISPTGLLRKTPEKDRSKKLLEWVETYLGLGEVPLQSGT
jgi:hypothetical protein